MRIAWFGSSLITDDCGNGSAAYYRGIIRALNKQGHQVTFYEPGDKRQPVTDPNWVRIFRYAPTQTQIDQALEDACHADIVIKSSCVGNFDTYLNEAVLSLRNRNRLVVFWDLDAPATLFKAAESLVNPFRMLIPEYDLILTYGGGEAVVKAYKALGAQECVPICNALDTLTHYPVQTDNRSHISLGLIAQPEHESRVDRFFINAATLMPEHSFVLAGAGWGDKNLPRNVRYVGHLNAVERNTLYSSAMTILNTDKGSSSRFQFAPPARIFEAIGAGACVITVAFGGIEDYLEPGEEILVAHDTQDVIDYVRSLTPEMALSIGKAARQRVLSQHTYAHRVAVLENVLGVKKTPLANVS